MPKEKSWNKNKDLQQSNTKEFNKLPIKQKSLCENP
jgi:hypothetical protein